MDHISGLPDKPPKVRLEKEMRLAHHPRLDVYNIYTQNLNFLDYRAIVVCEGEASKYRLKTHFAWRDLDLDVQLQDRALHLYLHTLRSPWYQSSICDRAMVEPDIIGFCDQVALSSDHATLAFPINYNHSTFSAVPPEGRLLSVPLHGCSCDADSVHLDFTLFLKSLTGWEPIFVSSIVSTKLKDSVFKISTSKQFGQGMVIIWKNNVIDNSLAHVTVRLRDAVEGQRWLTGSCT